MFVQHNSSLFICLCVLCDENLGILWVVREVGVLIITFWLIITERPLLLVADALLLLLKLIIHCWTVLKGALKSGPLVD